MAVPAPSSRSGSWNEQSTETLFPEQARRSGLMIRRDFVFFGGTITLTLVLARVVEMAVSGV